MQFEIFIYLMVESSFLYGEDLTTGFEKLQDLDNGKSILKLINEKVKQLKIIQDPEEFKAAVIEF